MSPSFALRRSFPRLFCEPRLLAIFLLLSASLPLRAQETPAAGPQKWALLIGIDAYKDSSHINSLGSAAADARAIKKALIEADDFPEDHVRLLVSDADPNAPSEARPERNAILRDVSSLARKAQPGDTVFIFFSGHGSESNGASYLLPYDADGFDNNTITDTAIDTAKLRERLQAVHAGLLVLAFDMCRNSAVRGSRDASAVGDTLKPTQVRGLDFTAAVAGKAGKPGLTPNGPAAVVTLFSCGLNERSYEWIDKGHGYFAYFLEQGLRGAKGATGSDGTIRMDTLTSYLAATVPVAVKQGEGKPQTPFAEIAVANKAAANRLVLATLPIDTHAYLTLNLSPADAAVSVDNVPQESVGGRVAIDLAGTPQRTVDVAIQAPGFVPQIAQIDAAQGAVIPLTITLVKAASVAPTLSPGGLHASFTTKRKTNPKDGAEMIWIPPGPFPMGARELGWDFQVNPVHSVTLSGYWIDRTPVTVAMYRKFCQATKRRMPNPPPFGWHEDHPIVNVSWVDASAYCAWAGGRLPSEAEWEKAARGVDGRKYPWGNAWDKTKLRCLTFHQPEPGTTAPVGSYPDGASPYGVLDMTGNAPQWCEDYCDDSFLSSAEAIKPNAVNRRPGADSYKVIRGGSYLSWYERDFVIFSRASHKLTDRYPDLGFRAAASGGQ